MKRKHFILALVAMLWSFSFSAYADDVIVVNSWAELKAALEANDGVQRSAARQRSTVMRTTSTASEETTEEETKTLIPNTPYYYEDFQTTKIQLGNDVVYDDALPIAKSNGTTLDLNGHKVLGSESAEHAYPFYNYGKFLVVDNSEAGTGAIYCGVKTGIKEDGVSINEEAVFVMTGGNIICTHDNEEDAAVVNYGIAYITGGTIEGANNAVLNQDGATMYILDGVLITGDVVGTGINAAPGVYTVAQIGTTKYGTLQAAIDAAVDGDVITLVTDVVEDEVLITQKADVDVTIDGAGKTFTGHMTINGASRYTGAETLTIKNVVFQAVDGKNECIAGAKDNAYAHNVTIEGCTFKGNDTYSYNNTFAVRFPSGAQAYGLTVKDCTADAKMFGLLWVSYIGKGATLTDGLIVDNCTAVGVQEGITLTTTSDAKIINSTIDATGVVIRAGQGGQAVDGKANNITLEENHLTSDGDVIVLRGDATDANLSMYRNAVSGTTHISGNTTDTKVSADANYWDGNNAPLVGSTDTPISVNSYYADEALTDLKRNQTGSISAFVYAATGRISGDVTSNAAESLLINIYGEDGNIIGTTSLENETYLIGTPKELTWRINLGADDSDSWAMAWNEGAPSANNMPAKVKLVVDDKEVAEADIKFTANGDGASPVFAAKTDADGKILSFVACEGEYNLNNANAKLAEVATAAATGDIITLIADGEYTLPVFAGKELTFKGASKEGVIINDAPDARTQGWNGSTIHFENLTAKGATANYHGLANGVVAVTYTNCNIEGLRFLYANEVSFDGCTFNAEGVEHSFWTYGASNVTVKNSTFTYTDRAVNCYSESGAAHETDITFEGCSFTYVGTATEPEGAVEINSASVKSIDVDFNNCTAPESGAMWFNSQWDANDAENTIVKVDGVTVWEVPAVAKIGDVEYKKLQKAIDAVKNGEEIILVADCAEAVSFTQTKEVSFVLNGNGKTMTGNINITARAGKDATSTLVIKNFNFKTDKTAYDFIKSVETNYYPNNITIQDCTFEGTSDINAEGYAVVAVRLKSANNITIKDCTGTGLHSFLQNTAGWNVTIDNVDITNSLSGFAMGTVQGTTIKNCDIVAQASGIRLDAQYNNNAVIADNKIEAFIPVVVRKASVDGTLTFNGTNDFTQTNTDGYWCVIGTSEYVANGALPTAATGKVSVTLAGEGLDPAGIYGSFGVASINRDGKVVNYLSLAEALDAALDGETVNLHWTAGDPAIAMAGTVCGKAVTITGTANVDWSKGWFYVGRNGAADGKVIFENANLNSVSNSSTYGINVSGRKNGTTDTYNGTVEFKNSTVVLDYLIQKNVMSLDNSTLTVKNGCSLTGRLADETESGELATSTTTLNNGSKLVVNNPNGMNLGYEGYGVLNIDETSSFEATQDYGVAANGTMNIAGKASVAGTLTSNGAINLTAQGATLTATADLTVNTDVADYKVAYIDGVYQLVEKDYIAQVGDQKFEVFTEALDAVENGGTITLLGGAFDESGKEMDFEKAITFTITGQAPEAKLPVITFQNATVNITGANFQIPELDARQSATINVDNSTVYSAGGNPIVKSYFNGAINITNNSKVYTHQLTTMGYINVDGTSLINVTWQTNVYGNGMITLAEGATFNTAGLNLIGKDYNGRDNTNDDRVGKPATIVVDGATLTAGKVYSASGKDYSYETENAGINVGTIAGKAALLDIKNGANVNLYMKDGYTINFGADATVNVDASTLNVLCRAENGTVTLANNGTVNVSGASNLAAAKVTGEGWFYMNGVSLDADTKLIGAKVRFASGENTVDGATIDDGFFQVGIGAYNGVDTNVDTVNGVVVNVKNNAKIGSNGDTYAGWVGTGFYDTDEEKAAVMTDAKYVLNIDNSIAEFGYLHVSNDGELNVNGKQYTTNYNNSDYAFYAGDFIINGTANFTDTDVLALYTKVSCDNGTDKPGTLNINGTTEYEAERHNGAIATSSNFTLYKTGVVNVAEGADLQACEASNIAANATLNIAGNVTAKGAITGYKGSDLGAINFTTDAATLTTGTANLAIGYNVDPDKKVVYADGAYKVVAKEYVAYIGEQGYESLAEALDAAADGDKVELAWAEGDPAIAMNGAVYGKSVTITGTATVDWSKDNLFVGRGGAGNGTVTFDGANLTSASANENSGLGIHVSGREKNTDNKYDGTLVIKNSTIDLDYLINKGAMSLDNSTLTVKNGFSIGGRPASETENGEDATATIDLANNSKVIVNNHNGMGLGYEAIGVMNIDATSTFETTQAFLVTAKGTMNVAGTVKIAGALTNNGAINFTTTTATLATTTEGLTISHNQGESYKVVYENGVYRLAHYVAYIGDVYYESLEAALEALTDGATLTLLENITVTEAWDCRNNGAKVTAANVTIDGNGKTLTLTGDVDDRNWDAVFRFEGDNATVKNLTIDASKATGIQRGITAKLSITVDNCTFIGNGTTAKRAIIFGEGAGTALANVVATVTNSTFKNWALGVSDNQSGKDAKSVTVSNNIFENASVLVSASETVTFDKNTLVGGYVNITSYTNKAGLSVHATENALDTEQVNQITVNPSGIYAQGGFSIPVAEVGGAYCLTLAGAISKANGATVTVLDDIILSEAVEVTTAAVLNLNDNSITPTTDATMTGGLFRLLDNADLTINGEGEISNNGNQNVYAAVSVLGNNAKLTVNGGNLTGHYYGIAGNGYKTGTQVTINGGVITSGAEDGLGIYHPQAGVLTVTGGEITGATGIYFKGGKLDIQVGTIKGTGADVDYVYNGSGCEATGDALVIENAEANGYAAIDGVSITGGTFISENAAPIASYAPEASDALVEFIGEGCNAQFNNANIDESLLVIGYQLKDEDGDGYYGVKYTNHRESMTIVDGAYTEFVNETELSVGTLTYNRTLPAAGNWYPLYVPFEIPVEALTALGYEAAFFYDVHFEVLAGGEINPASAPEVHIIKIKQGTLKANFPYVIRTSKDADLNLSLVLENTTLFTTAESAMNSVESGSTINRFIFAGTYKSANPEGLTGKANVPCYAVTNDGGFAKLPESVYLSPFRVHMSIIAKDGSPVILDDVVAESIKMRAIGEENEDGTTTIYDVEADEQTVDYIYDLQGRRVLEPQKGSLYIVNGKKIVF